MFCAGSTHHESLGCFQHCTRRFCFSQGLAAFAIPASLQFWSETRPPNKISVGEADLSLWHARYSALQSAATCVHIATNVAHLDEARAYRAELNSVFGHVI